MRVLVVGYGSIGARHARLLEGMGLEVAIVSRRPETPGRRFDDLDRALDDWRPSYVVIASRTSEHASGLQKLAARDFSGWVLVEKPLLKHVHDLPAQVPYRLHVGYHLRFHPAIVAMRQALAKTQVFAVHAYVGQYLPDWRSETDYRHGYSAHADQGGGALRDLSHELDYLNWMLGGWTGLTARGGHYSDLDIDSDDVFALIVATRRCPLATITMNYLDRVATRFVVAHTATGSLRCDLIAWTLESSSRPEPEKFVGTADDLYLAEHRAVLADDPGFLCTATEGLDVMAMIDAAERSHETGRWISR